VNIYRPDKFDPDGEAVPFDTAPAMETAASEKAKALRARATRYRQLAVTLYNQDLVSEVECLAGELEARAAKLEIGTYSFLGTPKNA
jgi:hypothetical protein